MNLEQKSVSILCGKVTSDKQTSPLNEIVKLSEKQTVDKNTNMMTDYLNYINVGSFMHLEKVQSFVYQDKVKVRACVCISLS